MTAFAVVGWFALAAGLSVRPSARVWPRLAPHAAGPPAATAARRPVHVSLADYTLTNWSEEQGPFPFGIYAIAQDQTRLSVAGHANRPGAIRRV